MEPSKDATLWYALKEGLHYDALLNHVQNLANIEFVELYVSDSCNLKCTHCFHGDVRSLEEQLSSEEWYRVVDQFVELGVQQIHISGREPFVGDKSVQLLQYLHSVKEKTGIKYGAITNGINVPAYLPTIQKLNIDYLDFSLDGLKESHEMLRGKETFSKTVQAIQDTLAVLSKKRVYVSSVVHKGNLEDVPRMIDYLHHLGVNKFFFQPLQPQGNAVKLQALLISPQEYDKLITSCVSLLERHREQNGIGLLIYVHPTSLPWLIDHNEWVSSSFISYIYGEDPTIKFGKSLLKFRFELVCAAFWRSCVITADGYYLGCCVMRTFQDYPSFSTGNVKQSPIRDLYLRSLTEHSPLANILRRYVNSLCAHKSCFQFCHEGCVFLNQAFGWVKDPLCAVPQPQ